MDTENEIKSLEEYCNKIGVKVSKCTHWSEGGEGTKDLAKKVTEIADNSNSEKFKFLYDEKDTLWNKIEKIAKEIYRAKSITADENVKNRKIMKTRKTEKRKIEKPKNRTFEKHVYFDSTIKDLAQIVVTCLAGQ